MNDDTILLTGMLMILSFWIGYCFGLWARKLTLPQPPVFQKKTIKPLPTRYLCGYHLASENRPGLVAIVHSSRCEACVEHNKA